MSNDNKEESKGVKQPTGVDGSAKEPTVFSTELSARCGPGQEEKLKSCSRDDANSSGLIDAYSRKHFCENTLSIAERDKQAADIVGIGVINDHFSISENFDFQRILKLANRFNESTDCLNKRIAEHKYFSSALLSINKVGESKNDFVLVAYGDIDCVINAPIVNISSIEGHESVIRNIRDLIINRLIKIENELDFMYKVHFNAGGYK